MNRKKLIEAIAASCGGCGIRLQTGFAYRMAPELEQMPAAWLEPPRIEKTEGRTEGTKHYAVKMTLVDICPDPSENAKEQAWDRMERLAARILAALGEQECVRVVTDAELEPGEFSLTAEGELSLAVKFRVQVPFCDYCDAADNDEQP